VTLLELLFIKRHLLRVGQIEWLGQLSNDGFADVCQRRLKADPIFDCLLNLLINYFQNSITIFRYRTQSLNC
jgi:hypothetical protein